MNAMAVLLADHTEGDVFIISEVLCDFGSIIKIESVRSALWTIAKKWKIELKSKLIEDKLHCKIIRENDPELKRTYLTMFD